MYRTKYYKKITSKPPRFDLKFKELWRSRELIGVLTKRSFQVRYRQTILGPIWLLIAPIFSSLISYLAFGAIAHMGTDGIPPVLFHLSGNAIWAFFSGSLNSNVYTFRNNAYMFSKVYFPRLTMSVSYILSGMIDFAIKMIMVAIPTIFYCVRGDLTLNPLALLLLPAVLILSGLMAMGIGIIVSSFTTKYRDIQVFVSFAMGLWVYLTPVSYPLSEIGNPLIQKLFYINPMTGIMELYRFALFGKGQILVGNLIFACVFTAIVVIFGMAVFNKIERNFTDTI